MEMTLDDCWRNRQGSFSPGRARVQTVRGAFVIVIWYVGSGCGAASFLLPFGWWDGGSSRSLVRSEWARHWGRSTLTFSFRMRTRTILVNGTKNGHSFSERPNMIIISYPEIKVNISISEKCGFSVLYHYYGSYLCEIPSCKQAWNMVDWWYEKRWYQIW